MTAQSNAAASPAVQRALDVEQTMARIPSFSSARILRNGEKVHVIADCSIRSDTTRRERRFTQTYSFIAQSDEIFTSELTPVPDEVKYSTATDDGQYKIVFRVATDKNGKTERVVELYSPQDGLVAEIDVTDKHADFLIGGKTYARSENTLMLTGAFVRYVGKAYVECRAEHAYVRRRAKSTFPQRRRQAVGSVRGLSQLWRDSLQGFETSAVPPRHRGRSEGYFQANNAPIWPARCCICSTVFRSYVKTRHLSCFRNGLLVVAQRPSARSSREDAFQ